MTLQGNDIETRYRVQFMFDVLKRTAKTNFETIADFGCSDGAILRSMLQVVGAGRGRGIDLNAPQESSDRMVLSRANLLNYVSDEKFQLVISNQVFEHIYEPWLPRYFQVLKASCAQHGVILISTPNRWRPKNLVRAIMLRRLYMMSANPGVPPEQHLGHHRECSYRELTKILGEYFEAPEWSTRIVRTIPRIIGSYPSWLANILVYWLLWIVWRPLVLSASQDHYVVIQHNA